MKRLNSKLVRKASRSLTRGMTLIEILIVIAIIGLMAGGIAAVVVPKFAQAKLKQAKIDCGQIHTYAEQWKAEHGSECPTVAKLQEAALLAKTSSGKDPWGNAYIIKCEGEDIRVVTSGPDGKEGSADDISVPEPSQGQ
jgi:general secretion pathway protein G